MSADPPNWFGEPREESSPQVDPPTVPVDWFGDIESDEFRARASDAGTTAADEATRDAMPDSVADRTGPADAESTTSEQEATGGAEPAGSDAESTATEATRAATEMDGTRDATAAEVESEGMDDESGGGFVGWLKSLFGLG